MRRQAVKPELLLASDMLDLGALLGLTRRLPGPIPTAPKTVAAYPDDAKVSEKMSRVSKSTKSPDCSNSCHMKPPPAPIYGSQVEGTQA